MILLWFIVFLCLLLIVQPTVECGEDKEDGWGEFDDEFFEYKVADMVKLLKVGHKFRKHKWSGGDAFEPIYMCTSKCVHVYKKMCTCVQH